MRALVPPIPGEPSPHGLLGGCIEVIETNDVHQLNGTDMVSANCAGAHPWSDCPDPAGGWTNPVSKTFTRPRNCSFEPVTAYAGVECSTFGITYLEARQRALESLQLGEQFVLEEWFMRRGLSWMAAANDLTPGSGALHIVNGIGVLETWLAANYGGQGVIHAPIGTASLLAMHHQVDVFTEETCPTTLAGNVVVLGAGYSANVGPVAAPGAGTVAPAGEAWIYITPPMRIRRDARVLVQTSEAQTVNTSTNDRRVLAETTFVPEVSCCLAAAVRVSLSACC
jgi:hypothetical protein